VEAHTTYTQKYTSAQRATYIQAHRAEASIHSLRLHLKKHNSSAVTTQRSGQKQVLLSRPPLRTKFLFRVFSYGSMLLSATVVIALNKEIQLREWPVRSDVSELGSFVSFRYSAAFIYNGQGHPRQTALRSVPDESYI